MMLFVYYAVLLTCFSSLESEPVVIDRMFLRYANCSGCTASCYAADAVCEDNSSPKNCITFGDTHRRIFFDKDKCFPDGGKWYKITTEAGTGTYTQVRISSCDATCSTCTPMPTAPDCLSLYSVDGLNLNRCNKYFFECVADHESRQNYIYVKPEEYASSESWCPPGLKPESDYMTVWDGDADCKTLNLKNLIVGKTWAKYFNTPWEQLKWFQPENPQCDWGTNTKAKCIDGRIMIESYTESFCGGEATTTDYAEKIIFGNDDQCSPDQMKFVCLYGGGPAGGAYTKTVSFVLLVALVLSIILV